MNGRDLAGYFGSVVRGRRNYLKISQEELAERAGLHRTYVADIERGARNPSLKSIEKIAKALQLSIAALFSPTSGPGMAQVPNPPYDDGNEPVDILLVENDRNDGELVVSAFKRAQLGNRVHWVRDGAEALAFVFGTGTFANRRLENRPNVVLLDLNLPKVDGMEVLRRIKSDERTSMIPVVVLTGSDHHRDIAECRCLGANACIVKPVDFQRFSQVTPQLNLSWMLLKPAAVGM
jgi:CheY-like chemotaxis protein/DNA-binding XRE family transcriptional regulator